MDIQVYPNLAPGDRVGLQLRFETFALEYMEKKIFFNSQKHEYTICQIAIQIYLCRFKSIQTQEPQRQSWATIEV